MSKQRLISRNYIFLICMSLVLWTFSITAVINVVSINLRDLAAFTGVISSTEIEKGIGRSTYYYASIGLNNNAKKFHVGTFGERLIAELLVQQLHLGDHITIHFDNATFSQASTDARVYQVDNSHEVIYAFDTAKQEDRGAAIGLVFISLSFTLYWGYIILRDYHNKPV